MDVEEPETAGPGGRAFQDAWPRVVRTLAAWCGDLDAAEEHAAEAFARAVERERRGEPPPADLAAWCVTVARRSFVDQTRRRTTYDRLLPQVARQADAGLEEGGAVDGTELDDRLALLFVACDDALPAGSRMVLALRVVCGLSMRDVATHLGIAETAASARLTRAKKALAQARGRFVVPDTDAQRERLPVVLDCVAGMFTVAHRDGFAPPDALSDLGGQALSIADALVATFGDDPEVRGLRALVLLGLARRPGRVDADGVALTLDEVDRSRWDARLLRTGLRDATLAARTGTGRFAIEAALSGLHATAPSTAATDWPRVVSLYDALLRVWPSPAVEVARLVAVSYADPGRTGEVEDRLRHLGEHAAAYARRDASFALADLLWRTGRLPEARTHYRALATTAGSEPVRRFCERRATGGA